MNTFDITSLLVKTQEDIIRLIKEDNLAVSLKQAVNFYNLIQYQSKLGNELISSGVLEIIQDNFGFLRYKRFAYANSEHDVYISPSLIKKFNLCTGDELVTHVKLSKEKDSYLAVKNIITVNGVSPTKLRTKAFEQLTPEYANKQLCLESPNNIFSRLIDIAAPIGRGQRGLIVSPPKVGKTTILHNIALSVSQKYPECYLIFLMIGERPEEVTEAKKLLKHASNVEILGSTFDEPASRHTQLADITLERAKRLVEQGNDVVVLLDSLTRLTRSYNEVSPSSGRVLSGGIEAKALHKAKRFFGAARNTQECGSLTIIATVLVDTGSKMDDVIFEEFKGTGNMELYLSRKLAERYIFPAINFNKSGTRRDDLLVSSNHLSRFRVLRRLLNEMEDAEALEFLMSRLKSCKTNQEFFASMNNM